MTMSTLSPGADLKSNTKPKAPRSTEKTVLLAVLLFLALWTAAVVTFGLPGLYLPALALVPVMWGLLVVISRG